MFLYFYISPTLFLRFNQVPSQSNPTNSSTQSFSFPIPTSTYLSHRVYVLKAKEMEARGRSFTSATQQAKEETDLRRGPWTLEEDLVLMNFISNHGEGRWNSLARCAGLKRTGKSCRLRWLNYLRPDVRRGNITPEEQLLIIELHTRWGNRWSKIAQHLPGRTDNEIKNYWRTRVQKHAKLLKCDVDSKKFKDFMWCMWVPRLIERIHAAGSGAISSTERADLTGGCQTTRKVDTSYDAALQNAGVEGTPTTSPPEMGGWWQEDPMFPCPGEYAYQGLPESENYMVLGEDISALWNTEDICYLQN
ncbi:hypothetical protein HPP92_027960 [Vanilla planifolia]|uniref:Uncharacterized protein n=1 Tax=Vanilla planifolia TaxID=51239 RepID=A0A835U3I1_VANPL|nr:hypothetical protein HPP92_027960 [Vanilla planifolia]